MLMELLISSVKSTRFSALTLIPIDAGHAEFLKAAKSMGDYLLVGIHDDQVSYLKQLITRFF